MEFVTPKLVMIKDARLGVAGKLMQLGVVLWLVLMPALLLVPVLAPAAAITGTGALLGLGACGEQGAIAEAAGGRVGQVASGVVGSKDAEATRGLGRRLLRHGAWGSTSVADLCADSCDCGTRMDDSQAR